MDEIKRITDRVTVMRDGQYVGTLVTEECTKDDIINMMVGRVIYEEPKTKSSVQESAPVVLKVEHLNAGRMVKDISFELHKGEILGFAGLMGSGRTETARAVFGADPKDSGEVSIDGKKGGYPLAAGRRKPGHWLSFGGSQAVWRGAAKKRNGKLHACGA